MRPNDPDRLGDERADDTVPALRTRGQGARWAESTRQVAAGSTCTAATGRTRGEQRPVIRLRSVWPGKTCHATSPPATKISTAIHCGGRGTAQFRRRRAPVDVTRHDEAHA